MSMDARTTLRATLPVVVAALAAILVSSAQSQGPSCKGPNVVTTGQDYFTGQAKIPGSLRSVLDKAPRGSTITFCGNIQVGLRDALRIDFEGITLQGPSTIVPGRNLEGTGNSAPPVIVQGDNVTIRGLNFSGVNVIGDRSVDTHILGNTFEYHQAHGNGAAGRSPVELDTTVRAEVGSAGEPNFISGNTDAGISVQLGRRNHIDHNVIDYEGHNAIDEALSHRLEITDNEVKGTIDIDPADGKVLRNKVEDRRGIVVGSNGEQRVVVADNKPVVGGGGIRSRRTPVTITGNEVTGSRAFGILVSCELDARFRGEGETLITDNKVDQAGTGIGFICTTKPPHGSHVDNNRSTNARNNGIVIAAGNVTVDTNTVLTNKRIGILVHESEGSPPTLTGDQVHFNQADGVYFTHDAKAKMRRGFVSNNEGAGAFVDKGAQVLISKVAFTHNRDPGIDLAPRGVTPNGAKKIGNRNRDWPDGLSWTPSMISGSTCPHCRVEGFVIEPDPLRRGNPANGEGIGYEATVYADASGIFHYKPGGISCGDAKRRTFTVTAPGTTGRRAVAAARSSSRTLQVTSEFSPAVSCTDPGGGTTTGGGGTVTTGGSRLDVPATTRKSSPEDEEFYDLVEFCNRVPKPPDCARRAVRQAPNGSAAIAATGQILAIRVKGMAIPSGQPGDPGPLNTIHFSDLRPQPDGSMVVMSTSQAFQLPTTGDPQQVSTFVPENFCVQQGDFLGLSTLGGYDPTYYPNGVPFQIFGSVAGSTLGFYSKHNGLGNGAQFTGSSEDGTEMLMQYDLGTGDQATALCPGGTKTR